MPPPSSAASSSDPANVTSGDFGDDEPATWQEFMSKYRHKKGDPTGSGLTMAERLAKIEKGKGPSGNNPLQPQSSSSSAGSSFTSKKRGG